MKNHQCRLCCKTRQCLSASTEQLQKGGDLIHLMNRSLYYKHGQSQNYFYSRAINQILRQDKRSIYSKFEDQKILDKDEEYLKQFYYMPNCQLQLKQLVRYYKFSIDHPMLYFVELETIILKYISSRSQIEYQWAMNQIEKETHKDGSSSKQSKKQKRNTQNKIETSLFLKELINDSQKSTTILQMLKNVDADTALEKDWQKQFTQSLVEQDLTRALQFSTFIQQKEYQKPKEFIMKEGNSQKPIYFGNLKKSLNLQLGTPRKANNIIQNNFNSICSTHANSGSSNPNNVQSNQNINIPTQSSVMNKLIGTNLHFFNHNPSHQNISTTTQSQNFITKTQIVNNSNSNIYKPQATMKIQPLRLIEVPKLKIKLTNQEPKSERKHDKIRQMRADCFTQRIKTQIDECHSSRSSVNVKPIVIKRRQNYQN